MQKTIIALACGILFSFYTKTTLAQFPSLVSNLEKAIFQIETYDEYGINLGTGTGFFINNKGRALTALHVLNEAKFAFIKDYKGRIFRINQVTRINEKADIAEFSIDADNFSFSYIPISTKIPAKGSDVFTIGFPEGYERAVFKGIISATQIKNGETVIQTSAAISEGSSGSPLLNMNGQAIGVISYTNEAGQNLNFAYALDNLIRLKSESSIELMGDAKGKFYFMNLTCKNEPNLNLTSIEFTDTTTVFNFIYTNISIAFGDGAFIYCNTKDRNQTFHINDRASLNRYSLQGSNLPGSIEEASGMKLGNVKTFKLIFGPIKELTEFDLNEGMPGGDWSFKQITLPQKQNLSPTFFEKFNKEQMYFVTFDIKSERYASALAELQKCQDSLSTNERWQRLSAIVCYKNGDYEKALLKIERSLTFLPYYSSLYADQYETQLKLGNNLKALESIEKAIELSPDYIEYYLRRAAIHYKSENWEKAVSDYSKFIDSGRECDATIYLLRGLAKAQIKDSTACFDLNRAKEMAESDREWEIMNREFKKHCN